MPTQFSKWCTVRRLFDEAHKVLEFTRFFRRNTYPAPDEIRDRLISSKDFAKFRKFARLIRLTALLSIIWRRVFLDDCFPKPRLHFRHLTRRAASSTGIMFAMPPAQEGSDDLQGIC